MNDLKFSILIPVYNMGDTIEDTLKSILSQSYGNFEIIIQDNDSQDKTAEIIKRFRDKRIKYFKNEKNIGAMMSLTRGKKNCRGDVVYLMAADDILGKDALLSTYKAFKISDNIGAVTRPYFWFEKSVKIPVRAKKQIGTKNNTILRIENLDTNQMSDFLSTLDQMSGLAYRSKYMKKTFRDDQWTCHAYPFIQIFKSNPVVFLKNYTVAIRIGSSATRANIYETSPMKSWIDMFKDAFPEKKFLQFKKKCISEFVASNYIGLVQIRNYGRFRSFLREVFYLVKYRPKNLINPVFWFFSFGCLIIPPFILIPLVDWYKNRINTKMLSKIKFEYCLKN